MERSQEPYISTVPSAFIMTAPPCQHISVVACTVGAGGGGWEGLGGAWRDDAECVNLIGPIGLLYNLDKVI